MGNVCAVCSGSFSDSASRPVESAFVPIVAFRTLAKTGAQAPSFDSTPGSLSWHHFRAKQRHKLDKPSTVVWALSDPGAE